MQQQQQQHSQPLEEDGLPLKGCKFRALMVGYAVWVMEPNATEMLTRWGAFGKGTLSRSKPTFYTTTSGTMQSASSSNQRDPRFWLFSPPVDALCSCNLRANSNGSEVHFEETERRGPKGRKRAQRLPQKESPATTSVLVSFPPPFPPSLYSSPYSANREELVVPGHESQRKHGMEQEKTDIVHDVSCVQTTLGSEISTTQAKEEEKRHRGWWPMSPYCTALISPQPEQDQARAVGKNTLSHIVEDCSVDKYFGVC